MTRERLVVVTLASQVCALACSPSRESRGASVAAAWRSGPIKLDNFGYRPEDAKFAIASRDPGPIVEVRGDDGSVALTLNAESGAIRSLGFDPASGDSVWSIDFSSLRTAGTYHIDSPGLGVKSNDFQVGRGVYREVLRAALKTFYLQRCGTPKLRVHAQVWADPIACHTTDVRVGPEAGGADRGLLDLSGGWHDAGDYNKYVWYSVSNAILYLLRAWQQQPEIFADGDLGIPESGNGVPDILDEVKWELDFMLKMQLPDGAVLARVHAGTSRSGAAPPSADDVQRFYQDPTPESAAVFTGSCALAAREFAVAGLATYAQRLRGAAIRGWQWLETQGGDSPERVWAAAEVFRLEPTLDAARRYVDRFHAESWRGTSLEAGRYDTHAAVTYVQAAGATPQVVAAMTAGLGQAVDSLFAADDLYRSGMPVAWYRWGSNAARAAAGVLLLDAARLGATGRQTPDACRRHALDLLHFFHGQNPLGMVYLTNMQALGGEHSAWQLYHHWFGQSQNAYSRANYVGKPAAVVEGDYPYLAARDNHAVSDDKSSAFGPAPGFVPGGPNTNYSGDATPPLGVTYPNRYYRDWNDQSVWTARSWEISENSIGYQGPYVALAAAVVDRP